MSAPDIDEAIVATMRASRDAGTVTVLLGAGASSSSGLPQWNELASQLLVRSGAVADQDVANLLVERQDPLLVAEAARTKAGAGWYPLVRELLYPADIEIVPSSLHLASAGLVLGADLPVRLATLNFDTLLEESLRTAAADGGIDAEVRSRVDAAVEGQYDVHHLHGYITPEEAEQVVLAMTDFIELVGDVNCWQRRYLQRAIDTGSLIIAGTSYRDPDVRQWVAAALRNGPARHDAVVLLARESYNMTRSEFAAASEALEGQWTAAGMRPVLLHDHDDVAQILRELPHLASEGYRAPKTRAQDLWLGLNSRFEESQAVYRAALQADVNAVRLLAGVDRANATLWVPDGDGSLVRWASHDRTYVDPLYLRRIGMGHDSAWLAGRAISEATVVALDTREQTGTSGRWNSVLAIAIFLELPGGPAYAGAVLSVGLPGPLDEYEPRLHAIGDLLAQLAGDWAVRLVSDNG